MASDNDIFNCILRNLFLGINWKQSENYKVDKLVVDGSAGQAKIRTANNPTLLHLPVKQRQ